MSQLKQVSQLKSNLLQSVKEPTFLTSAADRVQLISSEDNQEIDSIFMEGDDVIGKKILAKSEACGDFYFSIGFG